MTKHLSFKICIMLYLIFKQFLEIDEDWIDGPWGNRGIRRIKGEDIFPMITDSQLYKEFHQYAINVLKLENTS